MRCENKYNLSIEQNIFLVRRDIVDLIWKQANLEGIGATFPQIETIIEGYGAKNLSVEDLIAILNLKRGWDYIVKNINQTITYRNITDINRILLREDELYIKDSNYSEKLEKHLNIELEQISSISNETERAISMLLYLLKEKYFL